MTENHELAYIDYKQGMKYKEIAEKYGVTINTVKSWKTRHWGSKKGVHTKGKKSMHTKRSAKEQSPRKGIGNPAPVKQFTKRNSAATTHGFFRTIFPEDVHELVESIAAKSPLDMLWENIIIQHTAIARAQKIMYVADADDMTKEITRARRSLQSQEVEHEIQYAWDKQANFMNAQSRAMATLSNLIEKFKKLANVDDERRLILEGLALDIEKKQEDLKAIRGDDDDESIIDEFNKATAPSPADVETLFGGEDEEV